MFVEPKWVKSSIKICICGDEVGNKGGGGSSSPQALGSNNLGSRCLADSSPGRSSCSRSPGCSAGRQGSARAVYLTVTLNLCSYRGVARSLLSVEFVVGRKGSSPSGQTETNVPGLREGFPGHSSPG